MGAEPFYVLQPGADPDRAFAEAVAAARHEHGHGGYSGTIADKDGYQITTRTALTRTEAAAQVRAALEAVETVAVNGRATTIEPAREGTCRVGGHGFYAPYFFPTDRPVPDLCPRHDQEEEDARVAAQHRPLFAEITRLTGLTPQIQDTGGGTMTIVIPVNPPTAVIPGQPEPDWPVPCYLGLIEDVTAQGHLSGTVDFYATREAIDSGEGDPVAEAPFGDPQHPHAWARQIAAHHQLTTVPPAEPGPTSHS